MSNAAFRAPRQAKLRSSCDGCGAAKLKCDRGQPECGRCLSLGLTCVYGISRKMGKPPRERLRISGSRSTSRMMVERAGNLSRDKSQVRSPAYSRGDDSFRCDAGAGIDNHYECFATSFDAFDALPSNSFGSLLSDFGPTEFSDGLYPNLETGPLSAVRSPNFEGYLTPAAHSTVCEAQVDGSRYFEKGSHQFAGNTGHDCFREAHKILGDLSFLSYDNAHKTPQTNSTSASAEAIIAQQVPLDHLLHLNREAGERLGHLLTCHCAKSPYLALLYASIISRILTWYQQAAGCMQSAPRNSTSRSYDAAPYHTSLVGSTPNSSCGLGNGSPMRPVHAASNLNLRGATSSPALTSSTDLTLDSANMAIGTFSIDDQRVQAAMRIQLVSGEMRRAGLLIDQFTPRSSTSQCSDDEYTSCGIDDLYQSLHSWLKGQHLRIANLMRSRLRDLNT